MYVALKQNKIIKERKTNFFFKNVVKTVVKISNLMRKICF